MENPILLSYLKLRFCVSFLGEKYANNWWDSQFLNTTGQKFMQNVYPKATFSAALEGASRSAFEFHDNRIGKGKVFHLFRLPTSMEQTIHQLLLEKPYMRQIHFFIL